MTRVEIKGFKSVAKKTVLSFPGAITCIAGPNGCGKSNVVDAIRWALGEQSARAMRAGSMGDVIFAGTQDVPGSSLASVTLDFARVGGSFPKELDGFNEFSIARRLFRSGESIYTINDIRCRLKDITDLFLDTGLDRQGYAIIEQGRVKDVILAKPEDIRHILEEVAEVGKFRVKRGEAIKRLEATQGNLERIKDLLQEVGRQRDTLKAQAGKAKRYQVLRDKINTQTQLVWSEELDGIKRKKDGLDDEVLVIDKGILEVDEGLTEQNTRLGEINTRLMALKEDMDRVGAELQAAKARHALVRSEREACEVRLADMQTTITRSSQHRQASEQENQAALAEIEAGTRELEELGRRLKAVMEDFDRHKAQADTCQTRFSAVAADYDTKRAELFDAIGQVRSVEQRIGFLRQRREEVAANIAKRTQELAAMSTEEETLRAELESLTTHSLKHTDYISQRRERVRQLKDEQAELLAGLERDSQHLIALEKRHTELATKITMLGRIVKGAHGAQPNTASNGFKRVADAMDVQAGFEEAA
ncbi:MAG: AAA family ATPase, partial [Syntrophaceae bacterium]